MSIQAFSAENFRCLEKVELELDEQYNLIFGANASGKTSILEALAYLGRGKSFRGASTTEIVRHGESDFVLFGRVSDGQHTAKVGVRNGPGGLETRIDGADGGGAAGLAKALPLQVIDPDVHNLVSGSPDERRRYLDWVAFHVEPDYLNSWRRFRRALKQRNAALRSGGNLAGWNTEFVALAAEVDAGRRLALDVAMDALVEAAGELLGAEVGFSYAQGWKEEADLLELLAGSEERDRQQGTTYYGPHRADLRIALDERKARKLVSRGQQKLLACAMILAATETAQTALERPLLLLLDDPAAELDQDALGRLMTRVAELGSQVVATSLEPDVALFPAPARVFHVEQGDVQQVV